MAERIDVHKVFAEYFPGIEPWAYAVSEALSEGSICVNAVSYAKDVLDGIKVNPFVKTNESPDINSLNDSDFITSDPSAKPRPFVFEDHDLLYMHRYSAYQSGIAQKIKEIIASEASFIPGRMRWLRDNKELIHEIFRSDTHVSDDGLDRIERIDWQKAAALNACLHNFSIITGGPGTGKTTTVAKILAILYNQHPELKVALAAPTGKAAARLWESLRQSATLNEELKKIAGKIEVLAPKTIHRLLESLPQSTLFRHNAENPLEHDLVIIDESSMIDVSLMYKLLDSIPSGKRIIFLGDMNQLASVEAGSIFGDLCRTMEGCANHFLLERIEFCNEFLTTKIPFDLTLDPGTRNPLSQHVIKLFRNYRSESREITGLCRLIVNKEKDSLMNLLGSGQEIRMGAAFSNNKEEQMDSGLESMALAYIDYITEPDVKEALKKVRAVRILCALREGNNGVYKLNRRIEQLLKNRINRLIADKKTEAEVSGESGYQELFNPSGTFYHNQLIMVTSNNYELDVYNGDTGIVRRRSGDDHTLVAWFESSDPQKPKEILPGYLNDWETVYAMTIHKSQGSEFDSVVVMLPENEKTRILTRELLYTAVSRARKNLLIRSSRPVLDAAASREVNRASGIGKLF